MATALYRRYRPETFAEVIGQEHVTDPLRTALRTGRVGQAYLFSGPRGCGKTTSARILARCLNCAQGPTDTPCGVCDSCVELARGGSGSLDVVEIDAASHGGVDDARELRERATFSPARDRQKVFIIDEAHMVTPQGFNALLKIVEEPPPHIAFVFATTEPDKVLGTIRSRTHHYPFRLVPPQVLQAHLQEVCDAEGVTVGAGVLPLVVRAGAGSVRDSLSVLDQLAAGAGPDGIDYSRAVSLLGYTHATLLDDVTAAFAAGDGATVFRVVDRVITSGQDPRRFVDDLLQRLRDLVVVQAVGERSREVFPGVPSDQLERMALQAAGFGAAQLSRAADLANAAATEMTGATSPRLHLELLCARMLLPGADDAERGLAARLDRVERRLAVPGPALPGPAVPGPALPDSTLPDREAPAAHSGDAAPRGAQQAREVLARRGEQPQPPPTPVEVSAEPQPEAPAAAPAASEQRREPPNAMGVEPDRVAAAPTARPGGADTTEAVRRMWPEVLDHLATVKRRTWTRVSQGRPGRPRRRRAARAAVRPSQHPPGLQHPARTPTSCGRRSSPCWVSTGWSSPSTQAVPHPPGPSGSPSHHPGESLLPGSRRTHQPQRRPRARRLEPRFRPRLSPRLQLGPQRTGRLRPRRSGRATSDPPTSARHAPPVAASASGRAEPRLRRRGTTHRHRNPPTTVTHRPSSTTRGPLETGPRSAARSVPPATGPRPQAPASTSQSAAPPAAPDAAAAPPPATPAPTSSAVTSSAAPSSPSPGGPLRGAALARSAVRSAAASASAVAAARAGGTAAPGGTSGADVDDEASRDDPDAEGSGQVGVPVVERLLGGRVVSVDERT